MTVSITSNADRLQQSGASSWFPGFLEDAEKFVRSHGSIIKRASSLSYTSALLFSLMTNVVMYPQWKERMLFITIAAGTRDD